MFLPPFRASAPDESSRSSRAATSSAMQTFDPALIAQAAEVDMASVFDFGARVPAAAQDASNTTPQELQAAESSITTMPRPPSANADTAPPPLQPNSSGLPAFSPSTQEILRRINATSSITPNSREWEAARQQVLKNMAAAPAEGSPRASAEFTTPVRRARGRGRPPNSMRRGVVSGTSRGSSGPLVIGMTTSTDMGTTRSRMRGGRPRGSGRGTGRGGRRKRKRDDSDEGGDALSESSEVSHHSTPKPPTITKSGRSITKPTAFTPIIDKPNLQVASPHTPSALHSARGGGRGGRGGRRSYRPPELALCAKCSRGHSPESNVIVFCDGCNTPWHQWCHDPHIEREVVEVAEKEWFCGTCEHRREEERVPLQERVSGEAWHEGEKRRYLDGLRTETLRALLLRALEVRPDLPLFPPRAPDRHEGGTATSSALTPLDGMTPTPPGVKSATTTKAHPPPDPYPDIAAAAATNDPPSTYPRPGHGPIKPKATTDPEDVQWLLDDDNGFGVFSHFYDGSNEPRNELNGQAPGDAHVDGASSLGTATVNSSVVGTLINVAGSGDQAVKGSWIQRNGIGNESAG